MVVAETLGNNRQVRVRQASVILLSVHQTDEGASVSATKHLLVLWLLSYSDQIERLRDISGMNHHESISVSDDEISWNAFNGKPIIWIFRTVRLWICRLKLKFGQTFIWYVELAVLVS